MPDSQTSEDAICSTANGAVIKRKTAHTRYSLNPAYPFGAKMEDGRVHILGRMLRKGLSSIALLKGKGKCWRS